MSETIKAPWSQGQVDALNTFQQLGYIHEYTCGNNSTHVLTATVRGWICRYCDYTQDWCHAASFLPTLKPDIVQQATTSAPNPAVEWLEQVRVIAQAGKLGEPMLDVTGSVYRAAHPDNPLAIHSFVPLNDLIRLLVDQFDEQHG